MVFIIPIVVGAAVLIAGGVGVAAGADGLSKIDEAKKLGKKVQKRYEQKQASVEKTVRTTQELAAAYGQLQLQVQLQTIKRFIAFIERIGQQASQKDIEFLEGLEGFSPHQIDEYKTAVLEAESFAKGGFKAAGAAYAAGQSAVGLIGLFGTASTGTAISGLSGAAAWNATLAWLGGGSLASGGGGMALGAWVLGGIAVAPALMIGGFVLGGQGEKALTEAKRYEAKVNEEIANLDAFDAFLHQVRRRIKELEDLVANLNDRALNSLRELESKPFVSERDVSNFQQTALLIRALAEIVKTPILDSDGNLNPVAAKLKPRYQNI